jgi:stage V sporulation protein R
MSDPNTDAAYVADLENAIEKIWGIARRMGLDPYPVNFELVPATIMYEFGSYGLPGRFSHWSRGKAYYRMKTEYDYGLSKIYELVVNTNPSYAFLMEQNDVLQNKVVVAHVLGHTDMFKNNVYFKHTPPNMIDKVSVNADRIRKYEFEHGTATVERFLDAVLAIDEHIDPNFQLKRAQAAAQGKTAGKEKAERPEGVEAPDTFEDLLGPDTRAIRRAEEERAAKRHKFPAEPEKDLLLFFAEHAPSLEDWQRDILLIVREEMQYFVPQMQTKTLNEGWACLTADSLVLTERGLMRYDALHAALAADEPTSVGSSAGALDRITDRHLRRNAPTIRLRTRRGLTLEGAEEHKLNIGPDQWIALKDVKVGQSIPLSVGDNIWANSYLPVDLPVQPYVSGIRAVARSAGVNGRSVYRWLNGERTHEADDIALAVASTRYGEDYQETRAIRGHKLPVTIPTHINEDFAEFLGYLVGDGNIHLTKAAIGFTSGDRDLADRYATLIQNLFGVVTKVFWDERTISGKGGRWRVVFYATDVLEILHANGIDLGAKAPEKRIPDAILRSPKSVVSAFLRAYFDCDGCASLTNGVILSTFSREIQRVLQPLLLNYGILSRINKNPANVHIGGASAARFEQEIGFGLTRKREKLRAYVERHEWFLAEDPTDEIVGIEHDVADVYDITVDRSHQYVANGMIHHNSLWHARIMREMDLPDADYAAFAQMHSGVLAASRTHMNPYLLGYRILEDIERRWDNPTEEERAKLGRLPGQGRAKLFEVRENESDVSLLRNYLTKDLIEDLDLYLYAKEDDEWVIVEKDWEKVRDGIVASMTNFGYPYITIEDADFNRNSELRVKHHFERYELDVKYAQKTLEYVYAIWSRPVHLDTVFEERPVRMSYDGEDHDSNFIDGATGDIPF